MAGDTQITVIGNLTNDPELRFTPNGAAVANFTVASTPRAFDKNTNDWKDGETLFLRCSVWREYAENVAESLVKGTQVMVQGRLKSRSYETAEGEKRTVMELEVDDMGPTLRWSSAKLTKTQRSGNTGGGGNTGGNGNWGGNTGGQQQQGNQQQGGQQNGGQGGGFGGQQQGQQGGNQQQGGDPWGAGQPASGGNGNWGNGGAPTDPPF